MSPRELPEGVLEHVILPVRPRMEAAFEAAFARARPLISRQPGFRSLRLSRSLETPSSTCPPPEVTGCHRLVIRVRLESGPDNR